MGWRDDFRRDLRRYEVMDGTSARPFATFVRHQGLWALLQYRCAHALYGSRLDERRKQRLLELAFMWRKLAEILTGIVLPHSAEIGAGARFPHIGPVVVHREAVIGRDCDIYQGVTIGSAWDARALAPASARLGDNVIVYTNAVVAGGIYVDDWAVIGANAVVKTDIPRGAVAAGIPAEVIDFRDVDELERAHRESTG
jgi:serine O-acetyltransferase